MLESIKDLSPAQLNFIPEGFNNNIIWNMGHLVAAMQGVCYRRSGLPLQVSEDFFERFRPGSKPSGAVSDEAIAEIKTLLLSSPDQFPPDYEKGKFNTYESVVTRYGPELNNIEDAVAFLPFHEGLHIGCIMAMKRLILSLPA